MTVDPDRVPACLNDALILLDAGLTALEKGAWTNMTASRMFDLQAKLARVLLEEWSIDDPNTPLRVYFRKLGLDDSKEVSMLLVDAYWRKYNNEAIPVEDLVREYLED